MFEGFCDDGEERIEILWDTGATWSVTPYKTDFTEGIEPCEDEVMQGLSGSSEIIGKGDLAYVIRMSNGTTLALRSKAYYIPVAQRRILSPQQMMQHPAHKDGIKATQVSDRIILTQLSDGSTFTICNNLSNNLPTFYAYA